MRAAEGARLRVSGVASGLLSKRKTAVLCVHWDGVS
jgi:hypothetical protein